jgi:hypothetical protein
LNAYQILSTRVRLQRAIGRLLGNTSLLPADNIVQVRHRRTGRKLPGRLRIDGLHEVEQTPLGTISWTKDRVSIEVVPPIGNVLRQIKIDVAVVGVTGRMATVTIGAKPIWQQRIDHAGWIRIPTPRIARANKILVTFTIDPFVPRELDEAKTDERRLGLGIREISLLLDDSLPQRFWSLLAGALRRKK